MADYNIYIHDLSGQQQGVSPTKAWTVNESNQTKAWTSQATQEAKNGGEGTGLTSMAAAFKGVTAAAKSHPVIAAAAIVISIGVKLTDTIYPFVTRETGDYRFSTTWNNLKASFGAALNPIGSTINYSTYKQEMRLFNQKQEQERLLIGESTTNSVSRKV